MSRTSMRLSLILGLVALLVAVGASASAATSPQQVEINVPMPCDPEIERTITPLVVEAGSDVTVDVKYNFKCTGASRKIDFFLVIENTGALRPGGSLELLGNLKKGLTNFVNQVNYANGSRGGMTLYAEDYQNRVVLMGEERGRQALLDAIGTISIKPAGSIAGAAGAIRDTTQRLEENTEGEALQVLIIVDAGGLLPAEGPKLSDIGTSCQLAQDSNVYMVLVGLRPAGNRLASFNCVSRNGFYYSPTEDGSDLPSLFNRVAETLLKGKMADSAEYYDQINSLHFDYVTGSGIPDEPQQLRPSEYSWTYPPPGDAGQVIQYRAKAINEGVPVGGLMTELSAVAQLVLYYKDNTSGSLTADNPDICIYRKDTPQDCDNYLATLTPQATRPATSTPTATEPATNTPTGLPTEPTATPTPTDVPRNEIYLPLLLRNADL